MFVRRIPLMHPGLNYRYLGDVAHLAERFVRNEEVVGSIPIISTKVSVVGSASDVEIFVSCAHPARK